MSLTDRLYSEAQHTCALRVHCTHSYAVVCWPKNFAPSLCLGVCKALNFVILRILAREWAPHILAYVRDNQLAAPKQKHDALAHITVFQFSEIIRFSAENENTRSERSKLKLGEFFRMLFTTDLDVNWGDREMRKKCPKCLGRWFRESTVLTVKQTYTRKYQVHTQQHTRERHHFRSHVTHTGSFSDENACQAIYMWFLSQRKHAVTRQPMTHERKLTRLFAQQIEYFPDWRTTVRQVKMD